VALCDTRLDITMDSLRMQTQVSMNIG